jgi:hypothetical protein
MFKKFLIFIDIIKKIKIIMFKFLSEYYSIIYDNI